MRLAPTIPDATAVLRRLDPVLVEVQKGGEDGSPWLQMENGCGATASSWELKRCKLRTRKEEEKRG
jgi:hypothetical protein